MIFALFPLFPPSARIPALDVSPNNFYLWASSDNIAWA